MGITNEKALMLQEGANEYLASSPEKIVESETGDESSAESQDNEDDSAQAIA